MLKKNKITQDTILGLAAMLFMGIVILVSFISDRKSS